MEGNHLDGSSTAGRSQSDVSYHNALNIVYCWRCAGGTQAMGDEGGGEKMENESIEQEAMGESKG